MFAQFLSSHHDWPYPMFRVWHQPVSSRRATQTHGAILGGNQAIYLMGPFDGNEMNTIAVSAASLGQSRFTGMQMGPDGLGAISAARLVFAETDVADSRRAGIGLLPREVVRGLDHLGAASRSLRNEVDVFRKDVRPCAVEDQPDPDPLDRWSLVSTVEKSLKLPNGKDGLIRTGKRPFNPVDQRQLPFSTAVEMLTRPQLGRGPQRKET